MPFRLPRPSLLALAGWLAVLIPPGLLLGKAIPDYLLSATAVLFLGESLRTKNWGWIKKPWIATLLVLWLYLSVRTMAAGYLGISWETALGWIRFVLFSAALAEWILPRQEWTQRLLYATGAATGFLALDALTQYTMGYNLLGQPFTHEFGNRLTSVLKAPRVGVTLVWLALPVLLFLFSKKQRILAAFYGMAVFSAILLSGDRYPLLAALVMLGLLPLMLPNLRKKFLAGFLVLLIGAGGLLTALPDVRFRQIDMTLYTISTLPKTHYGAIWERAWAIFKTQPVTGTGVRRYREVCTDPAFGPAFSPSGATTCALHPHNMYLEWLVETGLIGLTLFCFFAGLVFHAMARLLRQHQAHPLVLAGLCATLALRFWPLAATPSIHIAWAAVPFWLMLGWLMSYDKQTEAARQASTP